MNKATADSVLSGGCLCRAIRYRVHLPVIDAGYCHCSICRRASGAPVTLWATVKRAGFAYTCGTPQHYVSGTGSRREFCPQCGTQLVFRAERTEHTLDFTVASLDNPQAITPDYHIWTDSQIVNIADDLPRYADNGPDD